MTTNLSIYTLLLVSLIFLIAPTKSLANGCELSHQNTSVKINTKIQNKCIVLKNINPNKTYITADPSFQRNSDYNIKVKSISGNIILDKTVSKLESPFHSKINTDYNSELMVIFSPLTSSIDYNFYVIHDSNTLSGETTIYIGLHSKGYIPYVEPPTCDGCIIQSVGGDFNNIQYSQNLILDHEMISSSSSNEASQCNDSNRPPEPPPKNRYNGAPLNVNNVLKESKLWVDNIGNTHPHAAEFAAAFARLIVMHKTGGALDVAHTENSDYVGSAAMGNFLYGANARSMGYTPDVILRGAAFYQPISQNGWSSFPRGVYNFYHNEGDNPGDPEQTMLGIKYQNEVFLNNRSDTSSFSCLDAQTLSEGSANTGGSNGGGSSGGSGSGEGSGSGGFIGGGSGSGVGTWWCFVQTGQTTYCWLEY